MNILTRHLIRAHTGPFLFAVSALTGLLFLNAVAREMEKLAGKGLPWDVLAEFLVLSLPHTVALTLPMAVLVAVLYAFSEMAASNEITAMRAGGISPAKIMRPLLLMGALVASAMLYFNDQVLPESNHRLRNLMLDINRKSPTFVLQEQVVNRVTAGQEGDVYFLLARRIDNTTSSMQDVVIMDQNRPGYGRTTRADSGSMAFNESRTDLFLTLYDGVVLETDGDRPGGFQQIYFDKQIVPMRGVGNELERRLSGVDRGERELTLVMLDDRVAAREETLAEVREEGKQETVATLRAVLGLGVDSTNAAAQRRTESASRVRGASRGTYLSRDHVTQQAVFNARNVNSRANAAMSAIRGLKVEIHKKYTLAFACLVFVLIGAPLATRFPRGGLGLVIAASTGIFAVYWVGLIAGEDLAEQGLAPPWLAMWISNIVFTGVGILLFRGMGRETSTGRGGGMDEFLYRLRTLLRDRPGRGGKAVQPQPGEA
ncbi:MAG: LptF/LptG family permease [Gemmatimonadales bacterium]|jgi:lipopolysaccharide export system permease protein|nr:MAG: LptF/LptG family permease [Gemmatimonadales bacterium]